MATSSFSRYGLVLSGAYGDLEFSWAELGALQPPWHGKHVLWACVSWCPYGYQGWRQHSTGWGDPGDAPAGLGAVLRPCGAPQDRKIAHFPFHALLPSERETLLARKRLLEHMGLQLRRAVLAKEQEWDRKVMCQSRKGTYMCRVHFQACAPACSPYTLHSAPNSASFPPRNPHLHCPP